jgi:outer membrane protein assembly factor BamB
VLLAGAVSIAAVHGADWPQWGGSGNRNMVSPETGLPVTFTRGTRTTGGVDSRTATNLKWATKVGSAVYGNPTVADGRVYVGTDDFSLMGNDRFRRTRGGLVQCLNEATGELIWRLVIPQRTNLPKELHFGFQHLGVCSSPTVDGRRVYVVTNADEVICLDVQGMANGNDGPFTDEARYMVGPAVAPVALTESDADILWRFDLMDELGVRPHDAASCSILLNGDMLYVGTSNGVDGPHKKVLAPDAPALIVLDKRSGRLLAVEEDGLSARLYHAQWSSPSLGVVGGRTLIFIGGGDGVCYAFAALTGVPEQPIALEKVWSYDCNPPHYKMRDGKLIPYYEGDKRKRYSTNKNDGAFVGPSQIIATPVFHDGRIYVALGQDPAHGRGKGMLHCIDATQTGDITESARIWAYDGLDRTISTAAVADGLVYQADIAGRLHCLEADTGQCCWVHDTKCETWGGPLVADGRLYFGNKRMFYVMAAGREPQLLSEVRLGNPIYSTPIAANGVLYIASQHYLWAVQQDASGAE